MLLELLPALGRFGMEHERLLVVAGCLGELGPAGRERVPEERRARLDAVDQATRELELPESERAAR
jgi:hypothetical protein